MRVKLCARKRDSERGDLFGEELARDFDNSLVVKKDERVETAHPWHLFLLSHVYVFACVRGEGGLFVKKFHKRVRIFSGKGPSKESDHFLGKTTT